MIRIGGAVLGAVAGAFGGWDASLQLLVYLMAADYLSGVIAAWLGRSKKGPLSSVAGGEGIARKGLMLLVILAAVQLDNAAGLQRAVCRDAVVGFYAANEGLSFLENLALAGVPFPKKLAEHFKRDDVPKAPPQNPLS